VLGTHDLWLFAATVFVLNATPGVDLMLTLARTLQHGVRGGLAAAFGVSAGCVLHALAAAFGLAALLAASAAAFAVVKWAGAAYLLWLALGMLGAALRPTRAATPALPAAAAPGAWRLFRQGLLTNALNPKVALFFLALLPQFIDAEAPHKTLAFLFLGAWFVVQGTLFLVAFVLLVAPLGRWRPSAAIERGLQAAGGALFVALAAKLALAQRQ
jgi:threonine/homoserine/homoserine lactone efflux protein